MDKEEIEHLIYIVNRHIERLAMLWGEWRFSELPVHIKDDYTLSWSILESLKDEHQHI